jgi:hypothetical protein
VIAAEARFIDCFPARESLCAVDRQTGMFTLSMSDASLTHNASRDSTHDIESPKTMVPAPKAATDANS